jgi:hypothetical protein
MKRSVCTAILVAVTDRLIKSTRTRALAAQALRASAPAGTTKAKEARLGRNAQWILMADEPGHNQETPSVGRYPNVNAYA